MPIIDRVGRRSWRVRLADLTIHLVLVMGSVTMVFPLLMMLTGSVKGAVDSQRLTLLPKYVYDDAVLYKRWMEAKYNERTAEYNFSHRRSIYTFDVLTPASRPVRRRAEDWQAFFSAARGRFSEFDLALGNASGFGVQPEMQRRFIRELKRDPEVQGRIIQLNEKYGASFVSWDAVPLSTFNLLRRGGAGDFTPFNRRTIDFSLRQDRRHMVVYSLDAFFVERGLKPEYGQDIRDLNQARHTNFRSWQEVTLSRRAPTNGLREDWVTFVRLLLNPHFIHVADEALPDYQGLLRERYKDIALLNKRYATRYADFSEAPLLREIPRSGVSLVDWDYFISNIVRPEHLSILSVEFMYRDFLRNRYDDMSQLVAAHKMGTRDYEEFPLTERLPLGNIAWQDDWKDFVTGPAGKGWARPEGEEGSVRIVNLKAASPAWQLFLRAKYPAVDGLNSAYGLVPASFDAVPMPLADVEYFDFLATRKHTVKEFLVRNYATVLETLLYDGRAILNTIIYCTFSVTIALAVNPLAAYALSRYKPPSQYKLLLFLMLTMAFPPIVLGIPNFLLLRHMGLLNTFAALVLPSAASGYSIFLLKGFFDSLPRELYESAMIDGASEWTMFWHISMAASKPILAVVALAAFTAAYSNFMFAFIVCQDPKMWTMMVSIYQLMQRSSPSVSMAALVIAAIPTLLVFVFCQNIIIRGIVVPTEK